MQDVATGVSRQEQVRQLREAYPVFRIEAASAAADGQSVRIEFCFTAGPHTFRPSAVITGLRPEETALLCTPTAERLIRALAIVEAFSYWKAFCSPVIEVAMTAPDEAELTWWQEFWPGAMGEFFYRNSIAFTDPGFLRIIGLIRLSALQPGPVQPGPVQPGLAGTTPAAPAAPPLIMFSGGKDSLALALAVRDGAAPLDFFLYNPTDAQHSLAESLAPGGRILVMRRDILPELLALNEAGHPNGHTPYSAYLAFAAMLTGYLRGSPFALAGNSRSDDEPNVASYLGHAINHQWTKTYEFEAALRDYRSRWLPAAPLYSSPLRPLFELQIIASLSGDVDAYLRTASCNRTKGDGWCRSCAKCAWVFLATAALLGPDLAVRKIGGDMFADPTLADLYERMAGLHDAKPFECTGTEEEVRVAIRAVGQDRDPGTLPALANCLREPAISAARPLPALLADWGQDGLLPPALTPLIRRLITPR